MLEYLLGLHLNHYLLKLLFAAIFGVIIGIEREVRKKPVGIRTCTVISVVSCLLTIVSIEAANYYAIAYVKPMDPLRLAAQIVSGIGFIGAGVILKRHNDIVSGLTTAAMLWGASGIGISIGAGFIVESLAAFVLIFFGIEVLPAIVKKIGFSKLNKHAVHIELTTDRNTNIEELMQQLKKKKIVIDELIIDDDGGNIHLDMKAYVRNQAMAEKIYSELRSIQNVKKMRVE